MAFTIEYIYQAIDRFSPVAARVIRSSTRIDRAIRRTGGAFESLGRRIVSVASLARSKFAGIGASILAGVGISKLLSVGMRFQDALADFSAITGAAGENLAFYESEAFRLAKATSTAQDAVIGSFKLIASAKEELLADPKSLVEVADQILLLANASGLEIKPVSEVVLSSLNQYRVGAEKAAEYVNILAAGSKFGASEVEDTGAAIAGAGGTASRRGISFLELNAMIQVLAKNDVKRSEAATALRNVILNLETAEKVHPSLEKLKPSIYGIVGALQNLKDANYNTLQGLKLFGKEGLDHADILKDNIPLLEKFIFNMKGTSTAADQAKVRLAPFSAGIRALGVRIDDALIRTFLRLEPVLSGYATKFTTFLDSLKPEDIDRMAESLALLAESLVLVGKGLALPVQALAGLARFKDDTYGVIVNPDVTNVHKRDALIQKMVVRIFGSLIGSTAEGAINSRERRNTIAPLVVPIPSQEKVAKDAQNRILGINNVVPIRPRLDNESVVKIDLNINLTGNTEAVDKIKAKYNPRATAFNLGTNIQLAQ